MNLPRLASLRPLLALAAPIGLAALAPAQSYSGPSYGTLPAQYHLGGSGVTAGIGGAGR